MSRFIQNLRRSGALCLAAMLVLPVHAETDGRTGRPPLPGKVSFIDAPSGESPAARQKRLKKECKGRPNAGACLGMTR